MIEECYIAVEVAAVAAVAAVTAVMVGMVVVGYIVFKSLTPDEFGIIQEDDDAEAR